MQVKSQVKLLTVLLLILLPSPMMSLEEHLQIQNVQISLSQDFSVFPSQNTKDEFCNDEFVDNIYAKLALTQLQILDDQSNYSSIQHFSQELIQLYQRITIIQEQLAQYINLEINPKPLISPTYFKTYQKNQNGQRDYRPYQKVRILDQSFMQRLQKDKELYVFIKRTEIITKNTNKLDSKFVDKQRQIFLNYFPNFEWLGIQYVPELYGLATSEESLDNQEQFSVARYRYWNIRMYRSIRQGDNRQQDILINYLDNLSNEQIDEETRIFGCDLYAAMLFEFQCLLNLENQYLENQLELDFSLFRTIQEKFYTNEAIQSLQICSVVIPPQSYFIQVILGIQHDQNYQQYQELNDFINKGLIEDLTSEIYEIEQHFFEFDKYFIEFLSRKLTYEHLNIQVLKDFKLMFENYKQRIQGIGGQWQQIQIITIEFFKYLIRIQKNKKIQQKISEEGIWDSIKFQYLIFTYMRRLLLSQNKVNDFKDFDTFKIAFTLFLKRKLLDDDEFIIYIGKERYYSMIFITIEIITIELLQNSQDYPKQIYDEMEDTIRHGLLIHYREGQVDPILQEYINQYTLITDKDFIVPRIIKRIYLEDRIDDMLIFLNEKKINHDSTFEQDEQEISLIEQQTSKKKQKMNFTHLTERHNLYKALVLVIFKNQTTQDNETFGQSLSEIITEFAKNDSENKKEFLQIVQQINTTTINYMEKQLNIYQQIYQFAIIEIQEKLNKEPASDAFLSFIQLYQNNENARFDRAGNIDVPQEEISQIKFVFMNQIMENNVDYDDKWNEILFMDAMFLYPFIFVKHRTELFNENSQECLSYDPLTEGQIENEDDLTKNCVNQRQQTLKNLLLDENTLEDLQITQNDFVQHLIYSPEIYLQIEQFEFMIDSFQLFKIYRKINNQRLMTDKILNDIFFTLYRFIIQIRGDPNFEYDFDFWNTINRYLIQCMSYQRFSKQNDKQYYICQYGYQRYNEMYWFIKYAQYQSLDDFNIMKDALEVQRNKNDKKIYWGDRLHGSFNYITHYLIKIKTFSEYKNDSIEMIQFNKDNNQKLEIWEQCSYIIKQQNNNIDYCQYLYKIGRIIDEFNNQQDIQDNQYEIIINILLEYIYNDNDKIIVWQVLDYFQFEQDNIQDDIIEKIREIFDSKLIQKIKNNIQNNNILNLSQLLDIQDTKLIGQYSLSKYNQNQLIMNINEIQYGLKDSRSNNSLYKLINDKILKTEQTIEDFLLLQQNQKHNDKFNNFKIIHHIPLSLLLYYADEEIEFIRIANILKKLNKLEMLFLSDVKSGQMIINHFGVYIKNKFKNESKNIDQYTIENLKTFIIGTEQKVASNKIIKNNVKLNNKFKNVQNISLNKFAGVAKTNFSIKQLPNTIQNEQVNLDTKQNQPQEIKIQVVQKVINQSPIVINDTISEDEISKLSQEKKNEIQNEAISEQVKQKLLEMKNQKDNFEYTSGKISSDLNNSNVLSSIESLKEQNNLMQDQQQRLNQVTKTELSSEMKSQSQTQINLKVQKQTRTKIVIKRVSKSTQLQSQNFI